MDTKVSESKGLGTNLEAQRLKGEWLSEEDDPHRDVMLLVSEIPP